jgi:P pilus assembly chaperone PapD
MKSWYVFLQGFVMRFVLLVLSIISFSAFSAIVVERTRVIYNEKEGAIISVKNTHSGPLLLVQSWIEAPDNKVKPPFIITPPLFRLDVNQKYLMKIERISAGLPTDRESMFWVNINAIPAQEKNKKNQINFSLQNRVKLFYRPDPIKEMTNEYYKNMKFSYQDRKLLLNNITPFHVNFYSLAVNGVEIKNPGMLKPFEKITIDDLPQKPGEIRWSVVNDQGGLSYQSIKLN